MQKYGSRSSRLLLGLVEKIPSVHHLVSNVVLDVRCRWAVLLTMGRNLETLTADTKLHSTAQRLETLTSYTVSHSNPQRSQQTLPICRFS